MVSRRTRRTLLGVLLGLLVLALVGAFVMFAPPFRVADRLAKPSFCASCHNMEPQYAAFQASAHSDLDSCNDCHLPNDNFVNHWAADAAVGVRDLVSFHVLGRADYDVEATGWSRRVINANCIRCHGDLVEHVDTSQRWCWECHRIMYHRVQLQAAGRDVYGDEVAR